MTDLQRVETRVAGLETIPEEARPAIQRRVERWVTGEIATQGYRVVGRLAWKRATPTQACVIGLVRPRRD